MARAQGAADGAYRDGLRRARRLLQRAPGRLPRQRHGEAAGARRRTRTPATRSRTCSCSRRPARTPTATATSTPTTTTTAPTATRACKPEIAQRPSSGTNIKTNIVDGRAVHPVHDRRLDRQGDRAGQLQVGGRQDDRPDRPRLQRHRADGVREGRAARSCTSTRTNADSAQAIPGGVAVRATQSGTVTTQAEQRRAVPEGGHRPGAVRHHQLGPDGPVVAPERHRAGPGPHRDRRRGDDHQPQDLHGQDRRSTSSSTR